MLELWIPKSAGYIDGDEAYLMSYPIHVRRAFAVIDCYYFLNEDDLDEDTTFVDHMKEAIRIFAGKWGGLEETIFPRVLEEGSTMERLVAVFAIGYSSLPLAVDILLPLLRSTNQLERYAAACMLGVRQDDHALPMIEEYFLHDPVNGHGEIISEAKNWYGEYYTVLALMLATWGPSHMTDILYNALLRIWTPEHERFIGHHGHAPSHILYALGRRGKLSLLHNWELSLPRRQLALISLVLGFINAYERFDNLYVAVQNNNMLHREMISIWIEHFGISEKEGQECLRMFNYNLLKA